ncbi:hypothetical protein [Actinomadura parmotrematis]|uniref:Uncharacterized protein n=1 Tax=Actinomadura parmotrematis TaxID=2864039 RepID=A0ABS7FZA0_9ACTN|nr:hypothetical protein [Actinomadura parmotrematis]MBW8485265.1 hypothetical protein [Actinomadura parmotrematis]
MTLLLLLILIPVSATTTLAVLAYKGLWFSWYPHGGYGLLQKNRVSTTMNRGTVHPFSIGWNGGSAVFFYGGPLVATSVSPDMFNAVFTTSISPGVVCVIVGVIYRVRPARWMLPAWIRWMEGDPAVPEKPSNFYVDTRVDRVLRTFPFRYENTRAGAHPEPIPLRDPPPERAKPTDSTITYGRITKDDSE